MAALLVVAIGYAMSPHRALPCEKIHPFYLHRYFCVTTLAQRFIAYRLDDRGDACAVAGISRLRNHFTNPALNVGV